MLFLTSLPTQFLASHPTCSLSSLFCLYLPTVPRGRPNNPVPSTGPPSSSNVPAGGSGPIPSSSAMQLDDDTPTPRPNNPPLDTAPSDNNSAPARDTINVQLVANVMADLFEKGKENSNFSKSLRRIEKAANSSLLPHGSSALALSLGSFAKALMGIRKKNGKLPTPPTLPEVSKLESHRDNRRHWVMELLKAHKDKYPGPLTQDIKEFLEKTALAKIRKNLSPVHFDPPPAVLWAEANHLFGSETVINTYAELAQAGISRCTYDWEHPTSTLWNTTLITILLFNWNVWYTAAGPLNAPIIPENHNNHVIKLGCLQRWLNGRKADWRKQQLLAVIGSPTAEATLSQQYQTRKKASRLRVCFSSYFFSSPDSHLTVNLLKYNIPICLV